MRAGKAEILLASDFLPCPCLHPLPKWGSLLAVLPDSGCGVGRSQSPGAAAVAPELLPTLLFCWAVAAAQTLPRGCWLALPHVLGKTHSSQCGSVWQGLSWEKGRKSCWLWRGGVGRDLDRVYIISFIKAKWKQVRMCSLEQKCKSRSEQLTSNTKKV